MPPFKFLLLGIKGIMEVQKKQIILNYQQIWAKI
jgi:hypothetical protein